MFAGIWSWPQFVRTIDGFVGAIVNLLDLLLKITVLAVLDSSNVKERWERNDQSVPMKTTVVVMHVVRM